MRPIVIPSKKRHNKYGVAPKSERTVDGVVFASKWEAQAYGLLKLLIGRDKFSLQPEYVLQDGFRFEGKKHRAIKYVGDFLLRADDGSTYVLDTKSEATRTPAFRIKEKLFIHKFQKPIIQIDTKTQLLKFLDTLEKEGKLKNRMT